MTLLGNGKTFTKSYFLQYPIISVPTDMSKKLKDRLHDPAFSLKMWDHATYPLTFLANLYIDVACLPTMLTLYRMAVRVIALGPGNAAAADLISTFTYARTAL